MAYSSALADRVRHVTRFRRDLTEKKMFGGVGFLLHGNMLVGVMASSLIVRVGPDAYPAALKQPNVKEFDFTGRPMKGWIVVEPDCLESDRQLEAWIAMAVEFVETLPRK
jgi:TfoX/Sxy family transcriptional regulator of competence genes